MFKTFSTLEPSYDYIVVGSGAAGTSAALTLAESLAHKKILLIEAGKRFGPANGQSVGLTELRVPSNWGGAPTWNGRQCRRPTADYFRHSFPFFSEIEQQAANEAAFWSDNTYCTMTSESSSTGWDNSYDYDRVEYESFAKRIGLKSPTSDAVEYDRLAGHCARCVRRQNIAKGVPSYGDVHGYINTRPINSFLRNNERYSTVTRLETYNGGNLHYLVETLVQTIDWNNLTAVGVILHDQRKIALSSGGELVISAGVYESPLILQRSGYGPDQLLAQIDKTPIAVDAKYRNGIGENYWNSQYTDRRMGEILGGWTRSNFDWAEMDKFGGLNIESGTRSFFKVDMYNDGDWTIGGGNIANDAECFSPSMARGQIRQHKGSRSGGSSKVGFDGLEAFNFYAPNAWGQVRFPEQHMKSVVNCVQATFFHQRWPMWKGLCNTGDCSYKAAIKAFLLGFSEETYRILGDEPPGYGTGKGGTYEYGVPWHSIYEIAQKIRQVQWRQDSIHFGGTISMNSTVDTHCRLRGVHNVRIADLSVLPDPQPGNTMQAAFTIGRYCTNHGILHNQPEYTLTSSAENAYNDWIKTYPFFQYDPETELYAADGQSLMKQFLSDQPNIKTVPFYWGPLTQTHTFYHDYPTWSLCTRPSEFDGDEYIHLENAAKSFTMKQFLHFSVRVPETVQSGIFVGTLTNLQPFEGYLISVTSDMASVISTYSQGSVTSVKVRSDTSTSHTGWTDYAIEFNENVLNVYLNDGGFLKKNINTIFGDINIGSKPTVAIQAKKKSTEKDDTCYRHIRMSDDLYDNRQDLRPPPPPPPRPMSGADNCLVSQTQYKSFSSFSAFDVTDIVTLLRYVLGKPILGSDAEEVAETIESCGDYNADYQIDIIDIISYMRYLLGKQGPAAHHSSGASMPKHVLIFSKTDAFRHSSIEKGVQTLHTLLEPHFDVVDSHEDDSEFEVPLTRYSSVIFLSTTGNILSGDQERNFEQYMKSGGSFVGIHAAADTEYDWPFYLDVVGACFDSHPRGGQVAKVYLNENDHVSTEHMKNMTEWSLTDEYYVFKDSPATRGKTIFMELDPKTMGDYNSNNKNLMCPAADPQCGDGLKPMAWYSEKTPQMGRTFYTALGHSNGIYDDPVFQEHLLEGILWASKSKEL